MEKLIKELARRHVTVKFEVQPKNRPNEELDINYYIPELVVYAEVSTTRVFDRDDSPAWGFKVCAHSIEAAIEKVNARLQVVEPVIAFREAQFKYKVAVKDTIAAAKKLNDMVPDSADPYAAARIDKPDAERMAARERAYAAGRAAGGVPPIAEAA